MGYLLQPSCSLDNPSSITVAMCVNVPVGSGTGFTIFQSGVYNPNGQVNQYFSGLNIDYQIDETGNYQLVFRFGSAQSAMAWADWMSGDLTNPSINSGDDTVHFTAFATLSSPTIAAIGRGKPFHFLFAADLSSECLIDEDGNATSWNTASLVVDGVKRTLSSDNAIGYSTGLTEDGAFIPNFYSDKGAGLGPVSSGSIGIGAVAAIVPPYDPTYGAADFFIPAWSLGVADNPVGLPSTDGIGLGDSAKIQYRAVQVWHGQAIDPVSNYGKFITMIPGGGRPVNPSIAAASFGPQTYCFDGGKTAGPVNGGSGGSFTKIGTVNDANFSGF
jgi:hypothetical protein